MPVITLPDGSQRDFASAVTVLEVAQSVGPGLASATLAGCVDGQMVDASYVLDADSSLRIITNKDQEGLEIIRHSSAHLLAQAVKQLFPETQVTIGPVIKDGFFYDFARATPFTPQDLTTIESKMQQLAGENIPVSRSVLSRDAAVQFFSKQGEDYKAQIIQSIPEEQDLSLYTQGEFTDLCRGVHVRHTGQLKAFKIMKTAGAYWRGDSNNEMLHRIYGTAWADKKALKAYLHRLAEAQKRDHRKLGKTFDLFHFQEESPGMVFWHQKGWAIYQQLEQYIRETLRLNGYDEVKTPQLVDRSLWEKSGHWDKFGKMIFSTSSESRDYAVKPMNCPCHVQIYNQGTKSYRDLPLRMAEFGCCHRNEASGTLHGLMRVRSFVQDDAHIFCTKGQIQDEVGKFIDLLFAVYQDFGFTDIIIALSTRPDNRVGSDKMWDEAEKSLAIALDDKGLSWTLQEGEGAFYGPKIEFSLQDCLDRVWQCGTVQVDFSMPERLGAVYIDQNGDKQTPVMLHRAILGSLERFIGILIEQYAGSFPLWLAPVQLVVLSIADRHNDYASTVCVQMEKLGYRANIDLRNEKIGFKIRAHSMQRVPYILIVGDQEMASNTVAVRSQKGKDLGSLQLANLASILDAEIANKSSTPPEE